MVQRGKYTISEESKRESLDTNKVEKKEGIKEKWKQVVITYDMSKLHSERRPKKIITFYGSIKHKNINWFFYILLCMYIYTCAWDNFKHTHIKIGCRCLTSKQPLD